MKILYKFGHTIKIGTGSSTNHPESKNHMTTCDIKTWVKCDDRDWIIAKERSIYKTVDSISKCESEKEVANYIEFLYNEEDSD